MKPVLSVLWKAVVLYLAALAGFVTGLTVPALRITRVVSHTATSFRTYDFNWLIAVLLVYGVLLLIAAARRRFRTGAMTATVALLVTIAIVALFTQIGIKDTSF